MKDLILIYFKTQNHSSAVIISYLPSTFMSAPLPVLHALHFLAKWTQILF